VPPEGDDEAAPPDLHVRTGQARHQLRAGTIYRVGRDPDGHIVLADDRVSWAHGELTWTGAAWTYTDLGSTNGSFLDQAKVDRVDITDGHTIRLGSSGSGPALSFVPVAKRETRELRPVPAQRAQPAGVGVPPSAGPRKPASVTALPVTMLRIGRAEDNEIVLRDDELVSRRHAELRRTPAGYVIEDAGSRNGVFVNGARVSSSPVTERDIIGIGRSSFRLIGGGLHEFVDDQGAALVARDLVVTVQRGKERGKRLLDGVTFAVPGGCLLAVVGPSGAGKSTLVRALTGKHPADGGTVLYEDRDLYEHYAELRLRIGHVPQEDILHTQLTARRALRYSAELRFDPDVPAAKRNERVDEVLRDLELAEAAGKPVGVLSGGQRKRVNMAPELLARPSLLVLDEPTSGLDPNLDQSVLRELHRLAHRGMTVIVVTHNVMHLEECDQLLVMAPGEHGGRVAFYGPPAAALGFFRVTSWTEVFQRFTDEKGRDWAGEFRRSPFYAEPSGKNSYPSERRSRLSELIKPRPDWLRQAVTLTRRYARVSWGDRGALADMAALPLVVGALIRFFPLKQGLAGAPGTNVFAQEVLEIMVTSACLAGAAAAIRELVKERPIYERERAAGLSSRGYLTSKLALLSVVSVLQSVAMVLLGLAGRRLPAHGAALGPFPLLELLIATAVLAVASMCVGLLVSALVQTSEKAMQFLVTLTMAQVILSGGLLPLAGRAGLDWLSWIVPARWGLAAMASTVNLNSLNPPGSSTDPLWAPNMVSWLRDIAVVLVISALCVAATWASLRRLDPGRR
jgi:ABC-type multidrug transport system ATPase subunit/pSer/pThr/pTyr-binding forkhead associated (FHA) protein